MGAMRATGARRRAAAVAVAALAVLGATLPGAGPGMGQAAAQEGERPRVLRFGISAGLTAHDNLGLRPNGESATTTATLGLDFAYRLSTPIQRFALTGDVGLRGGTGPRAGLDGVDGPGLRLSYDRAVPSARLAVQAFARRSELLFRDRFAVLVADPGDPLTDPDDIVVEFVDGEAQDGEDLRFGTQARLELGRDAPFGVTLTGGYRGRRVDETDDPDLVDENRLRLGLSLRFDLDAATRATAGLSWSRVAEAGSDAPEGDPDGDTRETLRLNLGVTRDLPLGEAGIDLEITEADEGTRTAVSVIYARALPLWGFETELGLARGADGELSAVGALRATRQLRTGQAAFALQRELRSGDDGEIGVTTLSADYGIAVTPRTDLAAGISVVRTDPARGGGETAGRLSVDLSRRLAEDWSLDLGVQHRFERRSGGADARDNVISLGLRRTFTYLP